MVVKIPSYMDSVPRQRQPEPGRRRLTAERRRESIVEVARHAFAARGYDGVRTQDLAAAARVSEALIYQHFATKRDLYEEVVSRSEEALRGRLTEAVTQGPSEQRLARGLEAFVEFVADRSTGWALLVSRVSDAEILAYQREVHSGCIAALAELFAAEAGGSRSGARRRQLEQLAEAIAGGATALANWWSENPKTARREGTAMLVDFAVRGLDSICASSSATGRAQTRRSRRG
jgi:AcrR family transcriptional regulator